MEITNRQHAIIIGTLLGDGALERNGHHVRLRVGHSQKQKEYLWWKWLELQSLVTKKPIIVGSYHKQKHQFVSRVQLTTYSLGILEPYWNIFYPHGKKIISQYLQKYLREPLILAVWFMDDGSKRSDCNALRISTDAFPVIEQQRLIKTLSQNFGISSRLHKKGKWWNIYIPQYGTQKFVGLVAPYILPSMQYKIALAP